MLTVSLFAALSSTLLSVQGATITELVQQRASTLGRTVEALRANPSWMSDPAGQYTLFVANDAALAAANVPQGSLGKVLINQALDYNTATYYQILQDTVSDTIMVYDNYTPGTRPDPEIHCRFGTGEALTVEQVKADNGWLYILTVPIALPKPISETITFQNTNVPGRTFGRFMEAVTATGLGPYLDSVRNSTLWLPTDAAFQSANLANYNTAQVRAILMYHLTPNRVLYSTALPAGAIPSGLEGQNHNLAFIAEGARINDAAIDLADTFAANNVVIHMVNRVFVPTTVPEVPIPAVTATPSTSTTTGSASAPARATASAKASVSAKAKNSATGLASTGAGLTLMFVASLFL